MAHYGVTHAHNLRGRTFYTLVPTANYTWLLYIVMALWYIAVEYTNLCKIYLLWFSKRIWGTCDRKAIGCQLCDVVFSKYWNYNTIKHWHKTVISNRLCFRIYLDKMKQLLPIEHVAAEYRAVLISFLTKKIDGPGNEYLIPAANIGIT